MLFCASACFRALDEQGPRAYDGLTLYASMLAIASPNFLSPSLSFLSRLFCLTSLTSTTSSALSRYPLAALLSSLLFAACGRMAEWMRLDPENPSFLLTAEALRKPLLRCPPRRRRGEARSGNRPHGEGEEEAGGNGVDRRKRAVVMPAKRAECGIIFRLPAPGRLSVPGPVEGGAETEDRTLAGLEVRTLAGEKECLTWGHAGP